MCIRDRDYAQKAVHQAIVNLNARPAPAGAMTVVLGNGWPGCLLYTSDAADERSSVDLGGRRIIKKKTIQDMMGDVVMLQQYVTVR